MEGVPENGPSVVFDEPLGERSILTFGPDKETLKQMNDEVDDGVI